MTGDQTKIKTREAGKEEVERRRICAAVFKKQNVANSYEMGKKELIIEAESESQG